jgi:hypothetical protein
MALLITALKGGYIASTPDPHRWNDHGKDVVILHSTDELVAFVRERFTPDTKPGEIPPFVKHLNMYLSNARNKAV